MNRRRFLVAAGSVAGLGRVELAFSGQVPMKTPSLLRPKVLRPGDTVGLITPATFVSDPDRLQLAEYTMKWFGLKWKMGRNVRKKSGYLGGSIKERLDDLHQMFADPDVRGIFAIRGGYGSAQLLDGIDYDLIRRNPKIFAGYSDVTALHLAIHQKTGLITFHGPTALSSFTEYTEKNFRRALSRPSRWESSPIPTKGPSCGPITGSGPSGGARPPGS